MKAFDVLCQKLLGWLSCKYTYLSSSDPVHGQEYSMSCKERRHRYEVYGVVIVARNLGSLRLAHKACSLLRDKCLGAFLTCSYLSH